DLDDGRGAHRAVLEECGKRFVVDMARPVAVTDDGTRRTLARLCDSLVAAGHSGCRGTHVPLPTRSRGKPRSRPPTTGGVGPQAATYWSSRSAASRASAWPSSWRTRS